MRFNLFCFVTLSLKLVIPSAVEGEGLSTKQKRISTSIGAKASF
jgi:hypothetical protein